VTAAPAAAKPAASAATKPAAQPAAKPAATKSAAAPVSINTASAADLDKLKGIGPARAKKIIEGRPYKAVDELDAKKILPHNVYMSIKDQLTL
jgi:DNA uptake protein ComE-like DNA-binding protein